MEAIVPYAIMLVLGLAGFGLLAIVLFGARSLSYGKIQPLTMVFIGLPLLIFAGLGFAMSSWSEAGVMAVLITFGLALASLLLTSIKGLIGL